MTNDDSNKSNKKDNFQNQMTFSVFSSLKFSISAFLLGSYYFARCHDSVRFHKRTIDLFSSNFLVAILCRHCLFGISVGKGAYCHRTGVGLFLFLFIIFYYEF